jgi:hypothetical protein
MVEESQPGNELTTSGDIEPDSSGVVILYPVFIYYDTIVTYRFPSP